MQSKNSTRSTQPKSGDGTQDVRKKQDANWFGKSQEPQEEFTDDHQGAGARSHRPDSSAEPAEPRTSEGSSFTADRGREALTPERADEPAPDVDNRH